MKRASIALGVLFVPFALGCSKSSSQVETREVKREEGKGEREERQAEAPKRVSIENGVTVIRLNDEEQRKTGLRIEPLAPASMRDEVRALGTVLDLQPLVELRTAYAAAAAQESKARAAAEAARREHRRVKVLFDDNRNASEKALDEATAALRSAEAEQAAAHSTLRGAQASARQQWGPVISRWIVEGAPELESVLARREVLIEISLPPDQQLSPPPDVVFLQGGSLPSRVSARYVSPRGQTDPQVQGLSFFYRAPSNSGLIAGMTHSAFLPYGPSTAGAAVPESAIVWWQGRAWAYVQAGPGRFERREIATTQPAPAGGYLVRDPAPGTPVVVAGAQALLSEEFRSQIQVGEEK